MEYSTILRTQIGLGKITLNISNNQRIEIWNSTNKSPNNIVENLRQKEIEIVH